jgi:DNA-binding XRE family transcriptional regulator
MNRAEFCELMAQAKKNSGVSTSELSFDSRMLPSTLMRVEKGISNFSMQKAIQYLYAIHHHISLRNGKKIYVIKDYEDLLKWTVEARGKESQRSLAKVIDVNRGTITKIETKKSEMSVDLFLKLVAYSNSIIALTLVDSDGK